VAQLVEALRYKLEGRGFDFRWCLQNLSLTWSWSWDAQYLGYRDSLITGFTIIVFVVTVKICKSFTMHGMNMKCVNTQQARIMHHHHKSEISNSGTLHSSVL
jgi:hypothetical protein